MTEVKGNIWDFHGTGHRIVVPTNNAVNAKGECVMGRGVALQTRRKFPKLPRELGTLIARSSRSHVHWFPKYGLFTFPVKRHWAEDADLDLIADSAKKLGAQVDLIDPFPRRIVYLPRVGCGNGRLKWKAVRPVLERHLSSDLFTIVELDLDA